MGCERINWFELTHDKIVYEGICECDNERVGLLKMCIFYFAGLKVIKGPRKVVKY